MFNDCSPRNLHSSIQPELFTVKPGLKSQQKKRMGATNVGVRRAHSYSWSLSSPQQPLETEDSPTVSSCPTIYIARRVPARGFCSRNTEFLEIPMVPVKLAGPRSKGRPF